MPVDQMPPSPPRSLPMRKRVSPPDVRPVTLDGVRYEALHWGRARGLAQNGGYLLATDVVSGRALWTARVYAIDYLPQLETDVQDIFIRSLDVAAGGRELRVVDERGRCFGFDVDRRQAWFINGEVCGLPCEPHVKNPAPLEHAKRRAPGHVEPVVSKGVRYEVLHVARSRASARGGGVIAAVDLASGQELWALQVYEQPSDPQEESDAQEVHITDMALDAAAGVLLLKNEAGQRFRINLADRSVTEDT